MPRVITTDHGTNDRVGRLHLQPGAVRRSAESSGQRQLRHPFRRERLCPELAREQQLLVEAGGARDLVRRNPVFRNRRARIPAPRDL